MKKLTLLMMACCVAIMSYAAGGNITYELNGGVTNTHGWKNKNDMYMGLNASWNAFKGTTTTWTSLDQLTDIAKGIPTEAAAMDLPFIQDATVKAEWQWLVDYMDAICADQGKTLPSSNGSFLRYNLMAFFKNTVRTGWPATADYTTAGDPDVFQRFWKHGFAGPATYDGTVEVVLPTPFKEDWIFDGWYKEQDFSGTKVTSIPVETEGDIKLYAKWIDVPYNVTIWAMAEGTSTKAGGIVTFVDGNKAYVQDATAGMLIEFTTTPDIAAGQKIAVVGKIAKVGNHVKVIEATLSTKEIASLPSVQTITLATLKADETKNYITYMYEYILIEGLKIASYTDGVPTLSDDINQIKLNIALNQTSFPVGTKINSRAVVAPDGEYVMLVGPATNIVASPVPRKETHDYANINGEGNDVFKITNKWLVSNVMDNFSANRVGIADHVRGMVAQNGKMYFIDRNLKQITVVDGTTGEKLAPIKLASNIFTYTNAEGEVAVAGTLPYNDIKLDAKGNVLIGNCITSNAQPFQVWKIDLATGEGTLVLQEILKDNPDFAAATVRFDAFGVYGDVDGDAIIMAANASDVDAYKWTITEGVAGTAEAVIYDTVTEGTYLTGLTNPGTAPQIFPMNEQLFYLDGWSTLPTLIDMDGNIVDGFFNDKSEDWTEAADKKQGHNGIIEFSIGNQHFFLMASGNTAAVPPSTFRLFKWANANKAFSEIQSLWTLPAAGMGASSNSYRTAVPSVEVDEVAKKATIYLYTGENGYGVYEFAITTPDGLNEVYNNNAVKVHVDGKTVLFDKEVAKVSTYSITGQMISKKDKVSSINVPQSGIYVIKATTYEGETAAHKVIVK